jgi:cobalt-zinc-cadmium efflux system membrane fusion protein
MNAATILLVDDDEVLRQVLGRVLTREGYAVIEAGTVAEALERARQQRPELALIDLRLPDGDGVEVAQQLGQEIGRFPLLLMTAYPLRLRDQPELARAFDKVLTKPLNLEELRQAIASSLRAAPREAPAPTPPLEDGEQYRSLTVAAPAKKHRLRWVVVSAVVVVLAGLAVAVPALGTPSLQRFLPTHAAPVAAPILESHARLVPGNDDQIELPPEVVETLGVVAQPVETAVAPRPLELAGSLAFDPNALGLVQARFAGEVVALGTVYGHASSEYPDEPILRYGDRVSKGQLLAVVLSKELGEKKSELVDAMVRLWLDEAQLERFEPLAEQGVLPVYNVMIQRALVATERNARFRVELTLQTWRVSQEEIDAIKEEAKEVYQRRSKRDLKKEMEWAKVVVRAPFDGVLVEKNVNLHKMVSTDFVLFEVADLRKLNVMVHAYEEDLNELRQLQRGFPWRLRTTTGANGGVLQGDGIQQVGLIVDPAQHTAPVMGLVRNDDGKLRVGQFVKATVELPAPSNVVSVPASAVEEDGDESILFVQPDPSKPRFVRRRVAVAMRLRDVIYIRSELSEGERKKGARELKAGEFIVTEGVLELQSALEDLQARAKARK